MLYVLYFGFWVFLALFVALAWWWGGPSERIAVAMMFAAAILTPIIGGAFNTRWHAPQPGVLLVDVLLCAGLLVLALRSTRFWPMTVVSLQIMAVLTHPALWIDPTILPFGYAFMQGFWAYPMMFLVLVGAWRRHRQVTSERRAGSFLHRGDILA